MYALCYLTQTENGLFIEYIYKLFDNFDDAYETLKEMTIQGYATKNYLPDSLICLENFRCDESSYFYFDVKTDSIVEVKQLA